jgi:release factor glutamine methyltransferase
MYPQPVTVLEVIQRGSEYLARRGVDSPRLQMELMLSQVLSLPRLKLYLNFERPLGESEAATLREMVRRRGEREPLQHILGTANFCGLEFVVDRRVLVPRPETELLAEKAWIILEEMTARAPEQRWVVDIGTGSGCLAIVLANKIPSAQLHAVDISEEALAVARENARRHGVRVEFHQSDYLQSLPKAWAFDLVVSNPPYVPSPQLPTLQPEVRDYDPAGALDGGPDGLTHYRRLAQELPDRLKPGGRLLLELGDEQAQAVGQILREHGWRVDSIDKDYNGMERILVAGRGKD